MLKKLSRKEEGFTVIEVLIVLAIAGLIMLIVFLAVPALQRNNRNTSRTSDVQRLLGAAQEVLNNNNGNMDELDTDNLTDAMGDTLAYYDPANISVATATGAVTNPEETEEVVLYKEARCNGGDIQQGTTRQMAVMFAVEGGNGPAPRCQES